MTEEVRKRLCFVNLCCQYKCVQNSQFVISSFWYSPIGADQKYNSQIIFTHIAFALILCKLVIKCTQNINHTLHSSSNTIIYLVPKRYEVFFLQVVPISGTLISTSTCACNQGNAMVIALSIPDSMKTDILSLHPSLWGWCGEYCWLFLRVSQFQLLRNYCLET